ncbi:ScbR family autoregulator-binding transcription factor [Streptomyces mutabilis]|uniref:ScbR family autoregulator-binding transcription factor n=1 Tax=Streptomyces mutabilis TaxID=67332 RepID=UPI00177AF8C6|nr:ScbR family autoregulator-binding transcription factor [Streptomyces mutabilis]GGQ46746.1 TetR family transcriptional regulator [Streptomyces mutabilis]
MSQQDRAARTQRALIRSAAQQFERYGYEKASLSDISSGAGVSRGALHFHFDTKADLAGAVESAAARTLRHAVESLPTAGLSALQELTDLSHRVGELLLWDVVVRAGFLLSCDGARHPGVDLCRQWQNHVDRLVTRAGREKSLAPETSPEDVVNAVVAATLGLAMLSRSDREWLNGQRLTGFWRLLLPSATPPRTAVGLEQGGTASAPDGCLARGPAT